MEGSFTSELSRDTSWHILDEASETVSGESILANVLETALPWNWGLCPAEVMIFEFALYFRFCYYCIFVCPTLCIIMVYRCVCAIFFFFFF